MNILSKSLIVACRNDCLNVVKYLVEYRADIYAHDNLVLRWSCHNGHINMVKFLVAMELT